MAPGADGLGLGPELVGVVLADVGEPDRQRGLHRIHPEPLGDRHDPDPGRGRRRRHGYAAERPRAARPGRPGRRARARRSLRDVPVPRPHDECLAPAVPSSAMGEVAGSTGGADVEAGIWSDAGGGQRRRHRGGQVEGRPAGRLKLRRARRTPPPPRPGRPRRTHSTRRGCKDRGPLPPRWHRRYAWPGPPARPPRPPARAIRHGRAPNTPSRLPRAIGAQSAVRTASARSGAPDTSASPGPAHATRARRSAGRPTAGRVGTADHAGHARHEHRRTVNLLHPTHLTPPVHPHGPVGPGQEGVAVVAPAGRP